VKQTYVEIAVRRRVIRRMDARNSKMNDIHFVVNVV
jgi:hypothetical protein